MSKRHEKVQSEEVQRELTRKEQLLRHRDRERHKKLYTFVGIALGLALALVLIGVVYQFLVLPNSAAAKVGDVSISTAQFQKRARFEQNSLRNQLVRLQQLEQQFGGQGFFQTQIAQIQATLASPFSLGTQALDGMIEDVVIAKEAAARGITVTDEEVNQALREEVANAQGLVTESQATATATAGIAATATASQWTPTPTATIDPNAAITETASVPTPPVPPPAAVITETAYTEGLSTLEKSLTASAGMSMNEYREIVRSRLLRDKLSDVIGSEQVVGSEEQVHARHILLSVAEPLTGTDALSGEVDSGVSVTATGDLTETAAVATTADAAPTATLTVATATTATNAATATVTGTAVSTSTNIVTTTNSVTGTDAVTSTANVTRSAAVTGTAGVTASVGVTTTAGNITTTSAVTNTAVAVTGTTDITGAAGITGTEAITGTHGPYPDAEALALANELRSRILAGEDFAVLASAYSDDTSSGPNGGDLGWFGKGRMVAPFEEAAFSLPVGQVSEPIKSDFGYHLIEVLEKDPARAKDEAQLQQERAQAFQTWLRDQLANDQIERPGDLTSLLPPGL
jgi:parvulin-like peptidyl-prolyl isomerase